MKSVRRTLGVLAIGALMSAAMVTASDASATIGLGHTPVTLCHYVPADGGSYVVITVDDDAATGNANSQGHMGHVRDIIPANPDGTCGIPD